MRFNLLLCVATLFLTMGFSSCKCNQAPGNNGQQVYLYSFEKSQPVTPDSSKQMIRNYLGIKDVHDLTINTDENVAYFVSDSDVNTTFEQNLSNGNFVFSKITTAYNHSVPALPSKDEALKIAENYMSSNNISPRDISQLKLVHTGGVRAQAVVNGQQAGPVIDKLITFTYGRIMDSLQVIGAGTKIIINIGDKGEVMGVTRSWREVNMGEKKEVKAEEMFTKEEAEAAAKKQIQAEFGEAPYEIKSSVKSYYDGNGNYLQPVWAFNTTVNLGGKDRKLEAVQYLCIIPLLKNTPEPLRLNVLDPRAKEIIKSAQPARDSTHPNAPGIKNND